MNVSLPETEKQTSKEKHHLNQARDTPGLVAMTTAWSVWCSLNEIVRIKTFVSVISDVWSWEFSTLRRKNQQLCSSLKDFKPVRCPGESTPTLGVFLFSGFQVPMSVSGEGVALSRVVWLEKIMSGEGLMDRFHAVVPQHRCLPWMWLSLLLTHVGVGVGSPLSLTRQQFIIGCPNGPCKSCALNREDAQSPTHFLLL